MSNLTADHRLRIREWAFAAIEKAIAAERFVELIYVDYRDQLTDDQIDAYLSGNWDTLWESLEEWTGDQQYTQAREMLQEYLSALDASDMLDEMQDDDRWDDEYCEDATDYLRELELHDLDEDALRFAVYDKDTSDPVRDLVRNTNAQLFRMRIAQVGEDLESYNLLDELEFKSAVTAVSSALWMASAPAIPDRMDSKDALKAAREMLNECGDWLHEGFSLDVIWYGDLETVSKAQVGDTLQFENAHVVLLDRMNGAGMDTETLGTIALTVTEDRKPHLDRTGPGYGWDDTAAVHMPAYGADVTVVKATVAA